MERDRWHHEMPFGVFANDLGRPAAPREDPAKGSFVQMRGLLYVGDDSDDAPSHGHVPHELGRPGVQLFIGLLAQAVAVLSRVGCQACRAHISS